MIKVLLTLTVMLFMCGQNRDGDDVGDGDAGDGDAAGDGDGRAGDGLRD